MSSSPNNACSRWSVKLQAYRCGCLGCDRPCPDCSRFISALVQHTLCSITPSVLATDKLTMLLRARSRHPGTDLLATVCRLGDHFACNAEQAGCGGQEGLAASGVPIVWHTGVPLTMLSIQPGAGCCTQEELAAICVLASIGHAEDACACVLELEVFVLEISAINGLSASAITCIPNTTLVDEYQSAQPDSAACSFC